MTMMRRWKVVLVFVGLALAATAYPCSAAEQAGPSLVELLRETQKQSEDPGRVTMVWWLAEEFWSVSFQRSGNMPKEQQEEFLKTVRPYLIVAAVDGTIGPLGGMDFVEQEALRARIRVMDKKGVSYKPLPEEELSSDVRNLVSIIRSMFGNTLGALGQGMHIFFFPPRAADGSSVAVASKEGEFTVKVGSESFKWRLPLASLVPVKVCPEDGERMNGAWKFCPWHGKPLVPAQ